MNKSTIYQIISNNNFNTHFEFDELGMTWQISFIRMVGGLKTIFSSKEHFYLSLIKATNMETNLAYGLSKWQDQVDFNTWCESLLTERIETYHFHTHLEQALSEINECKNDWLEENEPKFNPSKIVKPETLISYLKIQETSNFRIPTGLTEGFLAETTNSYFYLEFHTSS